MNRLEKLRLAVHLPDGFGVERQYARLFYLDQSGLSGADADVEYRDDGDGADKVVVTVSEWQLHEGKPLRDINKKVVIFDVVSGEILQPKFDHDDNLNELLAAMSGMKLVDESPDAQ